MRYEKRVITNGSAPITHLNKKIETENILSDNIYHGTMVLMIRPGYVIYR